MTRTTRKDRMRQTKVEQLREWRELFERNKDRPATNHEPDGGISVGQKSPVSESFRSTSESFLVHIGAV